MLASQAVEGEGLGQPTKPQHTTLTNFLPSHVEPIPTIAPSSHPKRTHKCRKTKSKVTEIPQSSKPTNLDENEVVHKERGYSVERAPTTTTSLDAEQGSGNGSVVSQARSHGYQCSALGKEKSRILEKKKKSRTPQLKRRLFKVRIESSTEKSLGDQKDTSKQGRNEIDQDEGIS
ncbi:hypothetical protein Tco_0019625 [Tanacetum coccineum]